MTSVRLLRPRGKKCFLDVLGEEVIILYMTLDAGLWSCPDIAAFSGKYNDLGVYISHDGAQLFLSSNRPANENDTCGDVDIIVVDRLANGWSRPYSLLIDKRSSEDRFARSIDSEAPSITSQGKLRKAAVTLSID